ncbi:hypothetical protein HNQ34_002177 [Anoxybacillus tepidamans]|uniref:Aspartyl-phosphate phosphatase Spo0E family protein n=1 Tax=Anoxybacteroides tepidamans TaxID=265948 RepID=A0A7W8MVN2_9BACL|nr:aspartyl-phosphate phosphatase Spo0E family protein [Anoxybacillus tepidamans]MBB5325078.1 hypothetical protein [Anoxybacillus tepidamans]
MIILMIEEKRQQMIKLALTYGFTAKETLQCSQELDMLINQYVKETLPMFSNKEHPLSLVPK